MVVVMVVMRLGGINVVPLLGSVLHTERLVLEGRGSRRGRREGKVEGDAEDSGAGDHDENFCSALCFVKAIVDGGQHGHSDRRRGRFAVPTHESVC